MRNTRSHKRSSWSVQYSNLKDENQFVGVYYKPDSVDEKEKEKEEKEEEKKEEESKEPKRVRDLTDKEKEKILNKLYYVEQNFVGRDKLHKIAVSKGYDMTRQFVGDWLKKQVLYQLTRPSTVGLLIFLVMKLCFNWCKLSAGFNAFDCCFCPIKGVEEIHLLKGLR